MSFKIVRNDITKMNTEAIVNTASGEPVIGEGCDSAVFRAAGQDELLAYRKEKIGFVPEGEVFITPGFRLPAKYIIHAVSPLYLTGDDGEEKKLRSCYRKSLKLAKENNIRSISFPLIATGSFGYPKEEAMRIAVDEIHAFLLQEDMEIILVVFDTAATALGEKIYPDLEAYIDRNYVKEKRQEEYGDAYFGSVHPEEKGYDLYREVGQRLENQIAQNRLGKKSASPFMGMASAMAPAAPWEAADMDSFDDGDIDFEGEHQEKLKERMQHLSDTFSQYLLYLIKDKKMKNAEVYKRAIVDKKIFSKIKNNVDYHPNKVTALCLCVGAKLNLDESKDLLARAGYALSPCDKTDIIFSYFIENEIYDMIELDIQLEEHGLPCIIS